MPHKVRRDYAGHNLNQGASDHLPKNEKKLSLAQIEAGIARGAANVKAHERASARSVPRLLGKFMHSNKQWSGRIAALYVQGAILKGKSQNQTTCSILVIALHVR